MLLRLYVNMCVFVCMVWIAISMAFNFARRIFWCPGSLSAMCVFLL